MRLKTIAITALIAISLVGSPGHAAASGDDPIVDTVGGVGAEHQGSSVAFSKSQLLKDSVAPSRTSQRSHDTHPGGGDVITVEDLPCAEWGVGEAATLAGSAVSEGDDGSDADAELLAAVLAAKNPGGSTAPSDLGGGDSVKEGAAHTAAAPKTATIRIGGFAKIQVDGFDQGSVDALWTSIIAAETAAEAGHTASDLGGGEEVCLSRYYCAGERVDDVVSGRIDGEADGAFAEYVRGFSNTLVASGPTSDVPFDPSDAADIKSVANELAAIGWGTPPDEIAMPVFNYCRINSDGVIEADVAAFSPTLTFATTITNEYDIPASRALVLDMLNDTLEGQPPQMATIPPIETGYTFAQFPMWLWLEEAAEIHEFEMRSQFQTIRVIGRATPRDVTWQLGDTEITCLLNEMKPWEEGLHPGHDKPKCHHVFEQIVDYTMSATITYTIQERVSYRGHWTHPWPPSVWVQHPTTPTIAVTSTTPQMTVHEIVSVNVPHGPSAAEILTSIDQE